MTVVEQKDAVRRYWTDRPCGSAHASAPEGTRAYFDQVERRRIELEPFIDRFSDFEAAAGRELLEIGVGLGTDFVRFARAGARATGIDLTERSVDLVRARLELEGLDAELQVADCENLPFADASFDVVYSWGVLHHTPDPVRAMREAVRVLRPGGRLCVMVYGRRSWVALGLWARYAALAGRPWRSLRSVVAEHIESAGTQAYTPSELQRIFGDLDDLTVERVGTPYDRRVAGPIAAATGSQLGWFIVVRGKRPDAGGNGATAATVERPHTGLRARQRQSGSLCVRERRVLRTLIRSTQGTRFGPMVTPQTFELGQSREALGSGMTEFADGERFFGHFGGTLTQADLGGLEVLDLGCGYGGRTVYYATTCGARHVEGIEISDEVVARCRALAERLGAENAGFRIAFAEDLPYDDGSFDAVLSFDVLEHVADPRAALREIRRVLRPGGSAWLAFPTYLGALASHLDYLTRLPALHRVWDPDVIIEVVNEFLTADPARYGTKPQPRPVVSALGRLTLPGLNGLRLSEARRAVADAGLTVVREGLWPIVMPSTPIPAAPLIHGMLAVTQRRRVLAELLVASIDLHVRR